MIHPNEFLSILDKLKISFNDLTLEQWQSHVMDTVAEHIGADKVSFFCQLDGVPPVLLTKNTHRHDNKAYLDYYYSLDPFGILTGENAGLKLAANPNYRNGVVSLDEVIDHAKLQTTEYYNDFLRPQKIGQETIIYLTSSDRVLGVLSVMHQTEQKLPKEKLELLRCLSPYISSFFENIHSQHKIQTLNRAISIFDEHSNNGIFIINGKFEVQYANSRAKSLLNNKGNQLSPLSVPKNIQDQCRMLQALSKTQKTSLSPTPSFGKLNVNDLDITVEIEHFHHHINNQAHDYFAIFLDPTKAPCLNKYNMKTRFGLTTREVEVVDGIFRGLKNSEIADELYVGETTVKKHIQNICAKMSLNNRTAIIYNMLKSSAMI